MRCNQKEYPSILQCYCFFGLKVLDGMLFRGPLPYTGIYSSACVCDSLSGWIWYVLHLYYGCFDVYCLHKFSKYIPFKLSIEKQWSIIDAWGLDLYNDI